MCYSVFSSSVSTLLLLCFLLSTTTISHQQQEQQQPILNQNEQDSVYNVLASINPSIDWRNLFPDDLCSSAPFGIVCDYFSDPGKDDPQPHITELRFGFVSEYSPNPACTSDSTINPLIFTSFPFLRKLFFFQCFTSEAHVSVPDFGSGVQTSNLEELVFINNPSLVTPVSTILRSFTNLKRLVLIRNGFYGKFPALLNEMINLEEITVSDNQMTGNNVTISFAKMNKLKVLDLSHSGFTGEIPDSINGLTELLKLDLGFNKFSGKIPDGIQILKKLELLDLSSNNFTNLGIPPFLGQISSLKELHLSGNSLGGVIPEIWENLGGLLGLGLSNMGLIGNIPNSIGVNLRNLCYLGLDNNNLEGIVPMEFGLLENVSEVNLENNLLSGKIPFTANFTSRVGKKLKLGGNPDLCAADEFFSLRGKKRSEFKTCGKKSEVNYYPALLLHSVTASSSSASMQLVLFSQVLISFAYLFLVL